MTNVNDDLRALTKNIKDLAYKPLLRGTLEAELLKLGHEPEEVTQALNATFKVVKH